MARPLARSLVASLAAPLAVVRVAVGAGVVVQGWSRGRSGCDLRERVLWTAGPLYSEPRGVRPVSGGCAAVQAGSWSLCGPVRLGY